MTNIEVGSKWVGPAGGVWRVTNVIGDDVYIRNDVTPGYVTVNKEWFLKTATRYEKKEPREFWLYRDSRQQPFSGILDSRPHLGLFADVVHVREVEPVPVKPQEFWLEAIKPATLDGDFLYRIHFDDPMRKLNIGPSFRVRKVDE